MGRTIETVASWKRVVASDIQMASISTELLPLYLAATWMQGFPSTLSPNREQVVLADSYIVLQPLIWISYGYLFAVSLSFRTVSSMVSSISMEISPTLRHSCQIALHSRQIYGRSDKKNVFRVHRLNSRFILVHRNAVKMYRVVNIVLRE